MIGKAEIMNAAPDSSIGGTYVGSPLGCVAGIAVLDEIRDRDLLERGNCHRGAHAGAVRGAGGRHPEIGDVRGLGSMLAVELVYDPAGREPNPGQPMRSCRRRSAAAC